MQVQANGITINYEVAGPEGAPVVTMSHSLAANLDMWAPQVEALKDRYRVVCYDTRGHGGSDAPDGDYSLDDLAEDTRQFLAALGIERTHFVGLSMGGMIGQVLAISYPTMFRSLSLCDTSARIPPETGPAWDERVGIAREKGMAALVDTTVERWFTAPFRADGEAALEPVREMIRTTPAAGYAGCCAAIKQHDQLDRISAIDAPTLVVVGADDMGTPVAAAEAINQRIAGSRLVVLESAGHLSNIEQPAAFSAALADFIDGVEEQPMEKRHG
jgi:3-oxoadipate enol-lactonase